MASSISDDSATPGGIISEWVLLQESAPDHAVRPTVSVLSPLRTSEIPLYSMSLKNLAHLKRSERLEGVPTVLPASPFSCLSI
jgi:hypothetical protein